MTIPAQGDERVSGKDPTANLRLVRRYYAGWNEGDIAEIEACVAPDMRGHAGPQSFNRATLISFRQQITASFDGVHEEDAIAQGDKVAMRWVSRWHARDSDEAAQTHGVTIYRIESGKITEMWDVRDRPAIAGDSEPSGS